MIKKEIISRMMWIFCIGGLFMASCTKMDHLYKDYIIERNYVGKPDSIWIQPGDQRVQIGILIPRDAEAKDLVIRWDESDSLVVAIDRSAEKQFVIIDNLEERSYLFDAYTRDGGGKRSLPMELNTNVYGDVYRSTIQDRDFSHSVVFPDSIALLWEAAQQETLYGMEIEFTDRDGQEQKILSLASALISVFQNADVDKPISVRSVFRPQTNAFEYFYTEPILVDLAATKRNTLTFTSRGYEDAAFVDFNLVRTFGQEEVPNPTGAVLDMCYALGSGSRGNLLTMNSPSFSLFSANWQGLISSWSVRNEASMKLNRGVAAVALYDGLDEQDRDQMIAAYENSAAVANTRLTILTVNDVVLLHSEDRDLYIAIKVLATPPAQSGTFGNFVIEFKISRQ